MVINKEKREKNKTMYVFANKLCVQNTKGAKNGLNSTLQYSPNSLFSPFSLEDIFAYFVAQVINDRKS